MWNNFVCYKREYSLYFICINDFFDMEVLFYSKVFGVGWNFYLFKCFYEKLDIG